MRALVRYCLSSFAMTAAFFLAVAPSAYAESSGNWSSGGLPGVKDDYRIVTTDPNRRDDQIRSGDERGFKAGSWKFNTWGDVSIGVGASSGDHK